MELIQHPEEEATPEGRVVLFFPRARKPVVRDWGKRYAKTKQEQSWFGKGCFVRGLARGKGLCSDFLKISEDFLDRCKR